MQRLGELQELRLIFTNAETQSGAGDVRYAVLGSIGEVSSGGREVVLALHSCQTLESLVEDLHAPPTTSFPPSPDFIGTCLGISLPLSSTTSTEHTDAQPQGHACNGLVTRVYQILREVGPALVRLASGTGEGERVRITVVGHSVAGSLAAMVTLCLRIAFSSLFSLSLTAPTLRCFSFSPSACLDASTADALRPCVTTIVLHDDLVPRLTPQSTRRLLREIALFRETVFRQRQQNWSAVLSRWSSVSPSLSPSQPLLLEDRERGRTREGDDETAVMVEDAELTPLWLPGKILHIYSHRGQWLVAEVSRTLSTLRRIEVQGNMLDDHRGGSLLHALLEARAVRRAPVAPPMWEAFTTSERDGDSSVREKDNERCTCCKESFSWHATYRGDVKDYRERYNCHHCGLLVCGLCSTNQRTIPKYGMIFPRRICDQCELKGDYAALC